MNTNKQWPTWASGIFYIRNYVAHFKNNHSKFTTTMTLLNEVTVEAISLTTKKQASANKIAKNKQTDPNLHSQYLLGLSRIQQQKHCNQHVVAQQAKRALYLYIVRRLHSIQNKYWGSPMLVMTLRN